ncbi:amino acid ABC transporter substrate-binding protein (PAAT family) [Motilibacter rhizosphaerae]|uniref:Amino acid ABC transporter substrate-binding protein (PAAT family) n=1 Tax=Motilibacter rhizosphaerae TaxID=598652 RepID=A0A4Q7NSN4_9ACTN|nr:ABC transporter substrate-binding protein [Motilibacter rhizosphaerae]RZS90153.1 amino acid ABC transporter substrate-binding protein (PAAT family) [Motilibacter rhizosphaerae]
MKLRPLAAVAALAALAACAQSSSSTGAATPSAAAGGSSAASAPASGAASAAPDASAGGSSAAPDAACAKDSLKLQKSGVLTVGTDKPAYDPWFSDDDPTNGKGYESAVAYAVAAKLGFSRDQVKWITVPFDAVAAPGRKKFDVDINQVSITDERKKVVDFSSGYYDVTQAIIARKDSPIAGAKTIADLKGAKLGGQIGTTSLDTLTDVVKPSKKVAAFRTNDIAKAALKNGQIDGLAVDLPTAFYITAAEIPDAKIVGQFPAKPGGEQFGMVLEKGSALTSCVSQAVDALRADGTLTELQQQFLAKTVGAPVLGE